MYDAVALVNVEYIVPKKVLNKIEMDETAFAQHAKRLVALDLYKKRGVALGYCAEVAEMTLEEFMLFLSENKVTIFKYKNAEEFYEEARNA